MTVKEEILELSTKGAGFDYLETEKFLATFLGKYPKQLYSLETLLRWNDPVITQTLLSIVLACTFDEDDASFALLTLCEAVDLMNSPSKVRQLIAADEKDDEGDEEGYEASALFIRAKKEREEGEDGIDELLRDL